MASKKPPVKAKKASAAKSRGKSGKSATKPASAAKSQRAHVSKSSASRAKSTAAKTKAASTRKKASDAARSAVTKAAAEKAAARKLAAQKAAAKKAAAARSAASKAAAKKAAAAKAAASRKAAASSAAKAKATKRQAAAVAESRAKAAVAKPVEAHAAPAPKAANSAAPVAPVVAKPQAAGAKVPPINKGIVAESPGAAEAARKAKAPTTPAPSAPLRAGPDQKRPMASESRVSMNFPSNASASAVQKPAPAVIPGALSAAAPAAKPILAPKPRPSGQKLGFKQSEFIVYPAHGVGQIVGIEVQEVAGFSLELFVVSFVKDKMILKVPTSKVASVGMRKLAETDTVEKALTTLSGRARVKRTMWSRRAQEYEAKINSGDLVTIAEVVRDLYRSDTQPEQSYSERQLYEAALDRMSREISAVRKLIDSESLKVIESYLAKGPRRGAKNEPDPVGVEADVERAA